jgi:serine/threonine-protein kinase PknG
LADADPWDWRVLWFLGLLKLAKGESKEAQQHFDQVYFDLPGELAPKLGLGLAAELAGNLEVAIKMYDLVSRTDPAFVSAAFGLSRCLLAKGDRGGAVSALDRVPQSAGLYLRSRINAARTLICNDHRPPGGMDLARAAALVESLTLDSMKKQTLSSQILTSAIVLMTSKKLKPDQTVKLFGAPLQETPLRFNLEKSFRAMAQLHTGEARISLVDRANSIRPRTLF